MTLEFEVIMMHIKFTKAKELFFSYSTNSPINLYRSEDGEIFTSKESLFRYLYEKERDEKKQQQRKA